MNPLEIFNDRYTLWWMVEGPLLLLVIYAAFPAGLPRKLFDLAMKSLQRPFGRKEVGGIRSVSSLSATLSVKRGAEYWSYVERFYGGLSSLFVFSIPLFVESAKPYRIILSILNLSAALYLCFFNGWLRNKVIGLIGRTRNRPDY